MKDYEFIDNSGKVKEALRAQLINGLSECGMVAERYAKRLCPVDTGNLRNSISSKVDKDELAVYIGTDVEYAVYVEMGTGIYAIGGGGTDKESWVYKGDDGKWHMAYPRKPKRFLRKAAKDHMELYVKILKRALSL